MKTALVLLLVASPALADSVWLVTYGDKKIQVIKEVRTATGLGLAFTLPFSNAQSMFVGAVIALAMEKKYTAEKSEKWIIPVSSGIIAGESLTEIAVKMLENFHLLAH